MNSSRQVGSVASLLAAGFSRLTEVGIANARLDAELFLAAVLGVNRLTLVVNPERHVFQADLDRFNTFIERRRQREPLAYIVGEKEFWGLRFEVSPAVLVPRPETELLVEEGLAYVNHSTKQSLAVLDLGTGSGCIAISLAKSLAPLGKQVNFVAVDRSDAALVVAKKNAAHHQVAIDFRQGSWWQALKVGEAFDLIVSNPPYIPQKSPHVDPELVFEPSMALYAQHDGLADINLILEGLPRFLTPGGQALVEIGFGQAEILAQTEPGAEFLKDLAGIERVLKINRPELMANS